MIGPISALVGPARGRISEGGAGPPLMLDRESTGEPHCAAAPQSFSTAETVPAAG